MFLWNDKFKSGYEEMDKQHRRLVQIIDDLMYAILKESNQTVKITAILHELDDYIATHFSYEEKKMEEHNYTEIQEHKNEHEDFKKQIRKINTYALEKDRREEYLNDMLKYTISWLTEHILKTDKKLASYLIEQELKMKV
jgi:hemerythrin